MIELRKFGFKGFWVFFKLSFNKDNEIGTSSFGMFVNLLKMPFVKNKYKYSIYFNNDFAGSVSLYNGDSSGKIFELGYFVLKDFRKKGIASEVVKLVVEKGFSEFGMMKIWAEVDSDNLGSVKVLKKNDFELEGNLKKQIFKKNKYVDELYYSRFNEVKYEY